jgi:hypothetical protein
VDAGHELVPVRLALADQSQEREPEDAFEELGVVAGAHNYQTIPAIM